MNAQLRPWLTRSLQLAALHNILWGAWQVLASASFFDLLQMEQPVYPMVWWVPFGLMLVDARNAGFPLR